MADNLKIEFPDIGQTGHWGERLAVAADLVGNAVNQLVMGIEQGGESIAVTGGGTADEHVFLRNNSVLLFLLTV